MKEGELGRVYRNGEVIFKEGETGEVMYVLQGGEVKITRRSPAGELTLGVLRSGEIFGEMALFDRLPRSATAIASGDVRILTVDRKKLFPTISKDPTLLFRILETMSKRIRRLDDEISTLKKYISDLSPDSVNIKETCSRLLEEARGVIPAESGSVMLLDEKKQYLSVKAAFGPGSDAQMRLQVGEGIAGSVLQTGTAELINNVSADSRFLPGPTKITSMLCVPIRCEGRNFGVINMSTASERLFTADDLKLLRTLATYASIAVQNVENFSHLRNATYEFLSHATLLDAS